VNTLVPVAVLPYYCKVRVPLFDNSASYSTTQLPTQIPFRLEVVYTLYLHLWTPAFRSLVVRAVMSS